MRHALKLLSISLSFLVCASCTYVAVKPDNVAAAGDRAFFLTADLHFDGNPDYIPGTIRNSKESGIQISYEYKVFYDGTKLNQEIIAGLMPTTILGLPTGGDEVLAVARLDIRREGNSVKSYSAEAKVSRPRSIFLGGTDKTAMRKKALLAVKENLELQMMQDRELLSKLQQKEGI